MAIPIITDWTILQNEAGVGATATLPTFAAGTNRIVEILIATYNGAGNANISTSASANGESAALIDGYITGVERTAIGVYVFLESQIAAINGQTLTTSGAGGSQKSVLYRVRGNCNQVVPTAYNKAFSAVSATLTMSLTRAADSNTTVVGFSSTTGHELVSSNPTRDGTVSLASGRRVSYGSEPDTANTSNTTVNGSGRTAAVVYNVEEPSAQIITDVNGGAGVRIGSTGNTASTSGFTTAPTSGTLGGRAIAITAYNSGTGVVTFNAPVLVHGETYPEFDANHTLVLTAGAESASLAGVPLSPPTGSTAITVASPNNVSEDAFGFILVANGITPVGGDKFYGIDADVTWLPNLGLTSGDLPVVTVVRYWDQSTGIAYVLNLTINGEGVVVDNRGLSVVGLSHSGLSVAGLSVVGL